MTNPDITDDDIRAAARVLAKAALLDPRISAQDHGTTLAWAEILGPPGLEVDDLLAAVTAHYSASTDRVLPADVLRLARAARRDRIDRAALNSPERQALEERSDAKALPDHVVDARRYALARAVASIGRQHDVETRTTFASTPRPKRADSPATIRAKVARARAAAPPAPMPADEDVDA